MSCRCRCCQSAVWERARHRLPLLSPPPPPPCRYTGPAGKNDQRSMNARWEKLQGGEGVASGGGGGGINGGAAAAVAVAAAAALAGLYFFLSAQYS